MKAAEARVRSASIVVLAQSFNPSIASKEWLLSKQIIQEEPINFTHAPVFSLFESANFRLAVDESRLSIFSKSGEPNRLQELGEIARRYVAMLPETPFKAVGFNYDWGVSSPDEPLNIGKLLAVELEVLKEVFSEKLRIGSIVVFPHGEFRVTLRIDPSEPTASEVNARFNYHKDVAGSIAALEGISKFSACYDHSRFMLEQIIGRS